MIINELDNVGVNLETGHKYALCDIAEGQNIIKYGNPIGHAVCNIKKGEHVHSHNMKTNLSGTVNYEYKPEYTPLKREKSDKYFMGYNRGDGSVGIRNDIWIVNTVGCVNKTAQRLSEMTGAKCFTHPFGCSQLGDDAKTTQLILKGLVNHPNAGGVLVLGLGCENNNIGEFKKVLCNYNPDRVKFLNAQDCEDEISEGIKIINELRSYADTFRREPINISKLKVGLKCGGSDGLSGITANPLVGKLSDKVISYGGACVLTEVPEMFGAEHLLMKRCPTKEMFNKTVNLINGFKDYFTRHNQVIYENPSPGNKAGGITTLEEKSLGCIQKGGMGEIADVLDYGDFVTENGLSLLNGPGNDITAVTNLTASGVHIILFTTGRGTPLGGPVPTLKIATNKNLAEKKKNWIDFDASPIADGVGFDVMTDKLLDLILNVSSGEKTLNEINDYSEISIFKDGIVL